MQQGPTPVLRVRLDCGVLCFDQMADQIVLGFWERSSGDLFG